MSSRISSGTEIFPSGAICTMGFDQLDCAGRRFQLRTGMLGNADYQ